MFRSSSICVAACVFALLAAGCVSQQAHQKKVNELTAQIQQLKATSATQGEQFQTENAQLKQELADAQKSRDEAKQSADALAKKYGAIDNQLVEQLINISGVTVDQSGNVQLTVSFKMGGTEITPEEKAAVEKFAAIIAGKDGKILVDGHSDNVPVSNPETRRLYGDNLGLSLARAAAVARVMADAGVPPPSMTVRGFDSNVPVASNYDAEGRAKNRRVEIIFLPASKDAQAAPPADQPAQEQESTTEPDAGGEEK